MLECVCVSLRLPVIEAFFYPVSRLWDDGPARAHGAGRQQQEHTMLCFMVNLEQTV